MVDRADDTRFDEAGIHVGGQRPPLKAPIQLSDNARTVLTKRYLRRGPDGNPVETEEEMFWRVAWNVAMPERDHDNDQQAVAESFFHMLTAKRFFPNSPTFTGAGTPLGQLAACFVLKIEDDMGRTGEGIFETLRNAALIQQTGGGNGFAFSGLRPAGAIVKSSNGKATGPIGFLRVYDQAFGEIAQGGCLTPETLVHTAEGTLRLDEIVRHEQPGWQSHDVMVATDEGPRHSAEAYNNGVVPVLRITTSEGIEITGTPNHKFKVMTADGPIWKQAQDLEPGDALMVMLGQHEGVVQYLDVPAQQHGNQSMPTFPVELTEELAFFLGLMTGDGFVASNEADHRIGITVAHNSYLIEELPELFARLFGEHITLHKQQKENDASVTFVADNRAIKDFLLLNGCDKPASTGVTVPRLIRQSPALILGAYLRGLFEADGALSHGYPQLLSSSEALVREVTTLLIGIGCPATIRQQPPSEDRYGSAPMWSVRVNSHVGLAAWREVVGTDERSRFATINTFEPDLNREVGYVLPHAAYWVEPVLDSITLPQIDQQGRGQGINYRATEPKLRKSLLRYMRGDRNLTLSGYTSLSEQYPAFAQAARPVGGLWFITVETVEEVGEALTLDMEVAGNHTYIANGIVTHNSRRGANMGVLRVDHPDIREFVTCKTSEDAITNFNISVGITDAFMEAVKNNESFDLIDPNSGDVWETVNARALFEEIVTHAHNNGEPGMLFLDAANRDNPVPHLYQLEATNPCGEQWLGPFENCCLGSVNLAMHVTEDGQVDWAMLRETVELATRFLDDVVDANAYVPEIPQLRSAAERVRRIGLGIMGLADMMYALGVRYGSVEGQEFAAQVMEFVHHHAMRTSVELARERGPFLAIRGSMYDPDNLTWEPPTPLTPYSRDWGRPHVDWDGVVEGIKQHGIRNGAQTTIAPTGTISTVAGVEGYGCEPVFALAYVRYFDDHGERRQLQYTSPLFEQALIDAGVDEATREAIVQEVTRTGTVQHIEAVPEEVRRVFVVSSDITAKEHVRMQAAMQRFVSNAISKTCNFPATATEEDVAEAFQLAWELGCKGLTVYVAGSREKVVLETAETKEQRGEGDAPTEEAAPAAQAPAPKATPQQAPAPPAASEQRSLFPPEAKKPRSRVLNGFTYRVQTPVGTAFITINENGGNQPFEVFINTAKAGSETAAVSEAMGRLISYILRIRSDVPPRDRLMEVVRQLEGIGGMRPLGLGPNRVRSLPDGVAQMLDEYIEHADEVAARTAYDNRSGEIDAPPAPTPTTNDSQMRMHIGDLCPECGEAAVVNEEGCRKCYACAYSEC